MAWLGGTLGEGFSNLKGQISKITKEVLAEPVDDDSDNSPSLEEKVKELEAFCDSQNIEISSLREENQHLGKSYKSEIEYLKSENMKLKQGQSYEFSNDNLQSVCQLENELSELRQEKTNLEKALDELDTEHQQEMKQLLAVKNDLKSKYDNTEKENHTLKATVEELKRKLSESNAQPLTGETNLLSLQCECSAENLKKKDEELRLLNAEVEKLVRVIEVEKREKEECLGKINELLEDDSIKTKLEKLVCDVKISEDERNKLEIELKQFKSDNILITEERDRCKVELDENNEIIESLKQSLNDLQSQLVKIGTHSQQVEFEVSHLRADNEEFISKFEEMCLLLNVNETESISEKIHLMRNTVQNLLDNKPLEILNDRLQEYEKLCEMLRLENEHVKTELEKLRSEHTNYSDELEVSKDVINKKNNEINDMMLQLENYRNSQCQTDDVKRLEQEVMKVKQILQTRDKQLKECSKGMNDKDKELQIVKSVSVKTEQQLANTLHEKEQLEQDLNTWKNTIQSKEEQLMEFVKEKQLLEEKITSLEKQTNENNKSENDIKMRYTELAESNKKLSTELEELYIRADKAQDLQKQLDKLLMTQSQMEKSLNDSILLRKENENVIQNLKAENIIKDSKISELTETCQKIETDLQVLKERDVENTQLDEETKKWKDLSVDLELQRQQLLENKCKLEEDNVEMKVKLEALSIKDQEITNLIETYNVLYSRYNELSGAYELVNNHKIALENQIANNAAQVVVSNIEEPFVETPEDKKQAQIVVSENQTSHRRTKSDVDLITRRSIEQYETELNNLREQLAKMQANDNQDNSKVLHEEVNRLNNIVVQEQVKYKVLQNEYQESREKEANLKKELDRLRLHLVEVEEHYTQEAVKSEEAISELSQKLSEVDDRLRNSTTAYTSASIRANQHVESLQSQAKLIAVQRDDLQVKLSAAEDEVQKHSAALTNLQIVLEQFQQDKEREIQSVVTKYDYQLKLAEKRYQELEQELNLVNSKLAEAKDGLSAASRLGEQLEKKSLTLSKLDQTMSELQKKLDEAEETLSQTKQSNIGKVDKSLLKNLVVGYISTQKPEDRTQVLRIMASVLDFNQDERMKTGVDSSGSGWLSKFLGSGTDSAQGNQSLSEAFIKFLENESRPQLQLKLHASDVLDPPAAAAVKKPPAVLSDLVLPTFNHPESQESSSILKDVLKNS